MRLYTSELVKKYKARTVVDHGIDPEIDVFGDKRHQPASVESLEESAVALGHFVVNCIIFFKHYSLVPPRMFFGLTLTALVFFAVWVNTFVSFDFLTLLLFAMVTPWAGCPLLRDKSCPAWPRFCGCC